MLFLLLEEFLAFLSVFPFFSKDFRVSEEMENPCFFGGFPCLFPKKQGKEDQGGDAGKGTGEKHHDNLRHVTTISDIFSTRHDNFRQFFSTCLSLCLCDRIRTRATQMTQIPSLKPLCLLYQKQFSSRHRRVSFACHREKKVPPIRSPPFKSARAMLQGSFGLASARTQTLVQHTF